MYKGHCYQRQGAKVYNNARKVCSAKGAIIAVPNTKDENDFLATTMNPDDKYTWIGFDYENSQMWEDGTSSSSTNSWRKLEDVEDFGIRNSQTVIFMKGDSSWQFDPNWKGYQFVCEKKALGISLYDTMINLYKSIQHTLRF